MDLWTTPIRDELEMLPTRSKENAAGPVAWVVFTFLRMLRWLGNDWATRTYERFIQNIGDVIYYEGAPPTRSIRMHEAVHTWQHRHLGQLRFLWRYYATRDGRRHAEAQAYAVEVVLFGRSAEERARAASDPVYAMGWEPAEARALIDRYVAAYRRDWELEVPRA